MSNSVNKIPILTYSPGEDDATGRSGQFSGFSAGSGSSQPSGSSQASGGSGQPGGSSGTGAPPASSGATSPPPPPDTEELYKKLNEMQQRTLENQVYMQEFEMAAQIQSAIHNATLKLISSIQG